VIKDNYRRELLGGRVEVVELIDDLIEDGYIQVWIHWQIFLLMMSTSG